MSENQFSVGEKATHFIIDEVAKRQAAEDRFYAGADPETGEVQ